MRTLVVAVVCGNSDAALSEESAHSVRLELPSHLGLPCGYFHTAEYLGLLLPQEVQREAPALNGSEAVSDGQAVLRDGF